MPSATSPGANSGDKTLSVITSGLAAGTPLTILLKTLTLSAAAFEAAMVASAIVVAMNEQALACSGFLRVKFHDLVGVRLILFSICAAIDRTLEHLHADCDEPV